jgi:hypothetical protein
MIYRGPDFLAVEKFARPPLPPSPVSKLNRRHTGRLRKRDKLPTGELGNWVRKEPNLTTTRKPGPLEIIQ